MVGSSARGSRARPAVISVLPVGLLLWLAYAMPAAAHANLSRAEPEPDSKLARAPAELRLYFTQALTRRASYVLLKNSAGEDIPIQVSFDDADPKLMRAGLPSLAPGVYTVKWQSLSSDDDDYADGSYRLIVLRPDGREPERSGASSSSGGLSDPTLILVIGGLFALAAASGTAVALRRRGSMSR